MRILIYLAVWKRPGITELCFQGIKRLQTHPDFEIEALAVISEEEMIPLCEKYGVHWVMHPNDELGRKKNFGLSACRDFKFDFLMEIGSDDLVLNCLLDDYKKFMVKYDFFGVGDMAFYDTEDGSCRRWQSASTFGAGRMISRKALEAMNFKIWRDSLRRGLDNFSIIELYKKGFKYWQIPAGDYPKVMDVKSEVNVWKFNHLNGVEYDPVEFFDKLSEDEKSFFECLKLRTR